MAKEPPAGFVPLKSLVKGAPRPEDALAEIRRIYFETTRNTIENDFAHAIELLKSLPSEDERERATVYMEGIAQMRKDWMPRPAPHGGRRKRGAVRTKREP